MGIITLFYVSPHYSFFIFYLYRIQISQRCIVATILDGENRIPFLRGMLTHYLIGHGFTFEEAYQVADSIRGALQKKQELKKKDMIDLVRTHVQDLLGDRLIGDGIFWEPMSRQLLIDDDDGRALFSLERLANSLTRPGLDLNRAHSISRKIETDFFQEGKNTISRDEIRKKAFESLREEYGKAFAKRYRVWHWFHKKKEVSRPMIVLIGGPTGVGKTSVSVALANLLKISRLTSTDEIRHIMRLMIGSDLMPALHASSFAAGNLANLKVPDNMDPIIFGFREQATRVCVGARAAIERAIEENESMIMDGVHLLPELIDLAVYEKQALFVWVNLYLSDTRIYKDRFKNRSQNAAKRPSHRYLESVEEILKVQNHILSVGQTYQTPAFENVIFDETVQSISLHIMDKLISEEEETKNSKKSNRASSKAKEDTPAADQKPVKA